MIKLLWKTFLLRYLATKKKLLRSMSFQSALKSFYLNSNRIVQKHEYLFLVIYIRCTVVANMIRSPLREKQRITLVQLLFTCQMCSLCLLRICLWLFTLVDESGTTIQARWFSRQDWERMPHALNISEHAKAFEAVIERKWSIEGSGNLAISENTKTY